MINKEKIKRCKWCEGDVLYEKYHDEVWGVPVYSDCELFEFLVLEGAQAGLAWISILRRRESYREAFDNYDLEKIVKYDEEKVKELLENKGIIRNRLKVLSVIKNAKAFTEIQKEFTSFSDYIWSYVDFKQIKNHFEKIEEIPTETELSIKISKDLKKRGFSFVGPTIIYAYMQAVGMVSDHTADCFKFENQKC